MSLFTDTAPEPAPRRRGGGWVGWSILGVALVGVTVVALVPAPYVIEEPGPVFDVLGDVTVAGDEVPMIQIPSEETFATDGSLDMLTVTVRGNRESLPNWIEVAAAYLDSSKAVVPVDSVYPPGFSLEDSNEQSRVDMENSQREAIAAALTELGYELPSTLTIVGTVEGGPAAGQILPGDTVVSLNDKTFADVTGLREEIAANGVGSPATVVVEREGEDVTLELTPELTPGENPVAILGVTVGVDYEFPFDVTIQLENVGGPSAGMMFALGIMDKLTPGAINGGEDIAGTGTISATGEVGPIGGIQQKLYGARAAGAEFFLSPEANCDEVVGNIPDGLTVFSVATLDQALEALEVVSSGGDASALPTCG